MSQTEVEKYQDPRTGGRWVKKPGKPKAYVVRLIQHGARVHLGIPSKLAAQLRWRRGELVLVAIEGSDLKIERLRVVEAEKEGSKTCDTKK